MDTILITNILITRGSEGVDFLFEDHPTEKTKTETEKQPDSQTLGLWIWIFSILGSFCSFAS